MRRRRLVPRWLLPGVMCVAAIGGAVGLKLHFDGLLDDPALAATDDRAPEGPRVAVASEIGDPGTVSGVVPGNNGGGDATRLGSEPATDDPAAAGGSGEPDPPTRPGAEDGVDGPEVFGPVDETLEALRDDAVLVPVVSSGRPWSHLGAVDGLLTFRGNPTRSYYGEGPVPVAPSVLWTHPIGCSISAVAGERHEWCGTGWTGQPAVFRLPTTGEWTVAFGGYDRNVTFLDPASGTEAYPPFGTGDIIKGSITIDPDGFPLLYTGSRDNFFHVVSIQGDRPEELWALSSEADGPTLWNNDWDGSALVIDDHLFVGGENGRFYVIRLNRAYDDGGQVTVRPEVMFSTESWDTELLAAIDDVEASVESSVAISGNVVYFANSGGLVQGWDLTPLAEGRAPERVLRFWTGDDTDATIVIDDEGMLYVASEYQRLNGRSREVGQIMKLDPSRPDDPLVWGRDARDGPASGVWATPALHRDLVIVATNEGQVLALDRMTGDERWRLDLPGPLWSSPVVVDDVLIQGDCDGFLHGFDLSGGASAELAEAGAGGAPLEMWSVELGGCIESTPAVWDGQIFVGTRAGDFFAVGDR